MTEWAPATEAETMMRDALRVDDQEEYFRILGGVDLLLPVSPEALAGRAPMGWATWTAGGRTHVLAFTSAEAMRACLPQDTGSARQVPFPELAAGWPNLEWWLAVNPGLPIEGYLPSWFVSQLARGDARLPGRSRSRPAEPQGRARVPVPPQRRGGTGAEPPAPPASLSPPEPPSPGLSPPSHPSSPGASSSGASSSGLLPRSDPGPPSSAEVGSADGSPEPGPPPGSPPSAAVDTLAGFEPANDLEAQLLTAVTSGRMDHFLSTLLLAKVVLPVAEGADPSVRPGDPGFVWRADKVDGEQRVNVFTSRERFAEQFDGTAATVPVRFVQLIRSWPDESWSLAVNPDTAVGHVLAGQQILALASSAAEVGLDDDAGEAGESGEESARESRHDGEQPVAMQKVIASHQVSWYLDRNYDRVSGFVHREREVAHLRTPAALVAGLGLWYEGSPFNPDAGEVYLIRWPAYRPGLYRIPYGGPTESAMAAMQGWVIERPPFRGNGFAPADSGDVIAEFKLDSIRLPHGAQLWRLAADGGSALVATLDADGPAWRQVEED